MERLRQHGGFFNPDRIVIAKPGEYCSETFIVLKVVSNEAEGLSFKQYVYTRIFRFMVLLRTVSQDITRDNYRWVPDLGDYSKSWTDEELYQMFGLTKQEQAYIESKIKELK